jgi:hypothetical protein
MLPTESVHEFVYPRVTPVPARTPDAPRTAPAPPPRRQRDLVMASLLRRPGPSPAARA